MNSDRHGLVGLAFLGSMTPEDSIGMHAALKSEWNTRPTDHEDASPDGEAGELAKLCEPGEGIADPRHPPIVVILATLLILAILFGFLLSFLTRTDALK